MKSTIYFKKKLNTHLAAYRFTLGSTYSFTSQNIIEFLAHLRLIHRSLRRETKNLKKNALARTLYSGHNAKKFQIQCHFFQGPSVAALETQSINAKTLTRGAQVNNGGNYTDIYQELLAIKRALQAYQLPVNDASLASTLRNLLQGKTNELLNLPEEVREHIAERLSAIAYLLFGCEVARNPASLIIHQIALDLVIAEEKSWHALLAAVPPYLPMAEKDSIERARETNLYCTTFSNNVAFYIYDESKALEDCQKNQFAVMTQLFQDEVRLIQDWLKLKGIDEKAHPNVIAKAITANFKVWFNQDFAATFSNTSKPTKKRFTL